MWRKTEKYQFGATQLDVKVAENVTFGNDASGFQVLHPKLEMVTGLDGVERPYGPRLISVSLNIREFTQAIAAPVDEGLSANTGVEAVARFVDYRLFREQGSPQRFAGADGDVATTATTAFVTSLFQQQLFGFRAGQSGTREAQYDGNGGNGKSFPPEWLSGECLTPCRFFPLILTYVLPDRGVANEFFSGAWTIVWEYEPLTDLLTTGPVPKR